MAEPSAKPARPTLPDAAELRAELHEATLFFCLGFLKGSFVRFADPA